MILVGREFMSASCLQQHFSRGSITNVVELSVRRHAIGSQHVIQRSLTLLEGERHCSLHVLTAVHSRDGERGGRRRHPRRSRDRAGGIQTETIGKRGSNLAVRDVVGSETQIQCAVESVKDVGGEGIGDFSLVADQELHGEVDRVAVSTRHYHLVGVETQGWIDVPLLPHGFGIGLICHRQESDRRIHSAEGEGRRRQGGILGNPQTNPVDERRIRGEGGGDRGGKRGRQY